MKELDQQKLKVLAQLNQHTGQLRSRLIVLAIDGDQRQADRWADEYGFPVGVISSQSRDLKAWNVDPAASDSTVFIVEKHIAGTVTGLISKDVQTLPERVARLAANRANNENGAILKWASRVVRDSKTQPVPHVATPSPPPLPIPAALPAKIDAPITQPTSVPSPAGLQLLVVGKSSANVVRFDLATGEATVVAKLANGSQPWSLAVNQAGDIFVGLRGGKKNIVRLVPGRSGVANGPLVPVDFSGTIGRFGPGLMAFDPRGLLNVAGDTNRAVHRYDIKTGRVVESIRLRAANLVGLTLYGDHIYAAEYFQKTILRFDLSTDPAQGAKFIYKSEHLDIPHGMTKGHNGNLFVSSLRNSRIQEYNGETGEFIQTFLDVRTLGGGKVKDLHFEPRLRHYFISTDNGVFELSQDGTLLAKHASDALSDAVAIAIVPMSEPAVAANPVLPSSNNGLIGYAKIGGVHVPVALRYQHGKVFQPTRIVGAVTKADVTMRDVKLLFRGRLHVPKAMTVKVFVCGGSSNDGHSWLRMAGLRVGPLGDDYKKNETYEIRLNAGVYPVEWTLTGGDFGCGLLKFIDAETSQLLSLTFTRADEADVRVNETIQVSSDKPGWPVVAEWIDATTTPARLKRSSP